MTEPPNHPHVSVAAWWECVAEDLGAMERDLQEPPLLHDVCFHAQQAVEKAIKAYMVALGAGKIPHTHNLLFLAESVTSLGGAALAELDLMALNRFSVEPRYAERPKIEPEEARRLARIAVGMAARIEGFIRELQPPDDGGERPNAT
jgi:HEPN domain-containing protein